MKKLYPLILCFFLFSYQHLQAQCPITLTATPSTIVCGDTAVLTAISAGCKPLNNDFNTGTTGSWASTPGGTIINCASIGSYACMGCSPDPPYFFFMGSTTALPRELKSNAMNLTQCGANPSNGGTACWLMKYNRQDSPGGPCEGPDAGGSPHEGVYFEYSINGGTSWITIQSWDPNGGNDPTLTSWNQYCVSIPTVAITSSTMFRWSQKANSGVGYDTWAIDKVQIIMNVTGYNYTWSPAASNTSSSKVAPGVNTVYTVGYSNKSTGGTDTCSASVTVNVTKPQVTISPVSAVCPGNSTLLTAISPYQSTPPTTCGLSASNTCNSISEKSTDGQVGAGATVNAFNSGKYNTFGDFGSAYDNSQMLFKAAELTAAGLKAGKITGISFNIARIDNSGGSGTLGSVTLPSVSISMKCTNLATLTAFQTGLFTVYSTKNTTFTTGWTGNLNFDSYFDWDGVSNVVVDVCWYLAYNVASSSAPGYPRTTDNSPGYTCFINSSTNFSPGNCGTTDFVSTASQRPNVKFSNCQPRTVTMVYNWSPATFLNSTTIRTPNCTPTVTSTYTVTAYASPYTQCATTATVTVPVDNPSVTISPLTPVVCTGTPTVTLTANASPVATSYAWSPATKLSSTTTQSTNASPTVNTTYTVKTTDASGCTATFSVVVGWCQAVPINMLENLSAVVENKAVSLKWITGVEVNNDHFVIEHSPDGNTFTPLGNIPGKGNSSVAVQYTFIDPNPLKGLNYYRLKQVDVNGDYRYTNTVTILYGVSGYNLDIIDLQPVPVKAELSYTIISAAEAEAAIEILNTDGKVIKTDKQKITVGNNLLKLDVAQLPNGVYIIRAATNKGDFALKRFLK